MKMVREKILDTIQDMCIEFLYYDRKEDSVLPVGSIEKAVKEGHITVDEIVEQFRKEIEKVIK